MSRSRALIAIMAMVVGLLALIPATPAAAAVTHVQTAANSANPTTSSISQAFSSNNTAGNTIVVAVTWSDSDSSVICSDTRGNTYSVAIQDWDGHHGQGIAICYASNVAAGANTVTATFSGGRSLRRIILNEYSGLATSSVVDVKSHRVSTATTVTDSATTGAVNPAYNGDLIFGAVMADTNTTTINPGTGFTERNSTNGEDLQTQDMVQTTAATVASTQTFGTIEDYTSAVVAFKSASATAATPGTGIQYVQSDLYEENWGATSISRAFAMNNTAGNTIVVTATYGTTSSTLTCSDTAGNTYVSVVNNWDSGNYQGLATCYATNIASGPNTVTASFGGSRDWRSINMTEYSGIDTANPVDVYAGQVNGGTSAVDNVSSGTATTTYANDLIYGAVVQDCCGRITHAAGTNFTMTTYAEYVFVYTEDRILTTPGSVAATFTFGSTSSYVAQMVAFRPASVSNNTVTSATVDPSMTFTVGSHGGSCNGVAQTGSATSTAVALGHMTQAANVVGAQDLHTVTNAGNGFTVFARWTGAPSDGNGHTLTSVGGSNASPVSFSAAGTEAFGYTTSDSGLSGTADRFTNPSAKWAAMTTSNAEVSHASGAADRNICVGYQVGVSPNTAAGAYTTTVIYVAVPSF